MSNKPNSFKNKQSKSIQIGNFHVSFGKDRLQLVKITAASGSWNLTFREDNPLFLWISNELKSEEGRNILRLVFTAYYAVCSGVPDSIFFEDILHACQRSIDRLAVAQEQLSDEADKEIIKEEKEKFNTSKTTVNDTRN